VPLRVLICTVIAIAKGADMEFILHKGSPNSPDVVQFKLDGPVFDANNVLQYAVFADGEPIPLPPGFTLGFDCFNIIENFINYVRQTLFSREDDFYWPNGELYQKQPVPSFDEIKAMIEETIAKHPELNLPQG
jgi:hypothetical protein